MSLPKIEPPSTGRKLRAGTTIALVVGAWRLGRSLRTWTVALLAVEAVQVAVGLVQANTGLPAGLVGIHMVLACTLAAAMTAVVLHLKEPVPASQRPGASADREPLTRTAGRGVQA